MRTRWSAYAGISAALAAGVVVKALAQRPNFYSATVYLSQSSANLMILTNFVFVTACTILLGLQKLLYGPLRPIEIEQLYEKAWFAVTETCLAMTIFRGEIGARFLVMFFALLAGKVWAWIGEGRIEILEQQPPRNPRLFHTRLALSLGLSVLFDLTMLEYVVKKVMDMAKPDMMVMFGFEFAVLSIVSLSTAARHAINLAEIAIVRSQKVRRIEEVRRERIAAAVREAEQTAQQQVSEQGAADSTAEATPNVSTVPLEAVEAARLALQQPIDEQEIEVEGWEGKGRWIFYLDLATDFFKLVVYVSFFFILLIFYGLPIHILRDVFMTFRSFFKRIGDFLRYRTATRDMNARYPDATEQDIGSEDVCIICREDMRPYHPPANGERANPVTERMRPKKLPCGHILHFSCLRSWLERQQICPTCRTNVVSRSSARQGQNNGPADGAPGQPGNAGQGERPGPRVYQWGPLRIGIGAARGNMLEDLQQQLGDNQPRQAQQPQGDGPQQYGFGIRWDGLRRRERGDRGTRSIQRQLDDVQRQISTEYRALGQITNELRLLRSMETELARIRAQRVGGTTPNASTIPGTATMHNGNSSTVHTHNHLAAAALTGNPQNTISSGSNQLPQGMTLPEGWSMMPLHPAQPGVQPEIGQNFAAPGQIQPLPPGFSSTLPHVSGIQPHFHPPLNPQPQQQSGLPHPGAAIVNGVNAPSMPHQAHMNAHQNSTGNNNTIGTPTRPNNERILSRDNQTHTNSAPMSNSTRHNTLSGPEQNTEQPQVNGTPAQSPRRPVQRSTSGREGPPVASMFSPLPSWGSVPMQPSTSTRAANDLRNGSDERDQANGASLSNVRSANQEHKDQSPTASSKDKNPTVEDLVEEPD